MDKDPTKLVDESLAEGWKMKKLIKQGSYGLFHEEDPTYDYRTVYNREDLGKLIKDGFFLDENPGLLALNIIMKI